MLFVWISPYLWMRLYIHNDSQTKLVWANLMYQISPAVYIRMRARDTPTEDGRSGDCILRLDWLCAATLCRFMWPCSMETSRFNFFMGYYYNWPYCFLVKNVLVIISEQGYCYSFSCLTLSLDYLINWDFITNCIWQ